MAKDSRKFLAPALIGHGASQGASVGACQDIPPIPLLEIKLTFSGPRYAANTLCACQNTAANLTRPVAQHVQPASFLHGSSSILHDGGGKPMRTEGCWHYAKGLLKSYLLLLHVVLFKTLKQKLNLSECNENEPVVWK